MLSKKEITERFEVTRTTLHNWKTTKPKLYELLLKSSSSGSELREIKIVLEKYSKTIISDFSIEDVIYILGLNLHEHLEELEKLHTIYIEKSSKDIKLKSEFVLDCYEKIQRLNIIERYIFISRIKNIENQKIKQSDLDIAIKHYFEEFLRS